MLLNSPQDSTCRLPNSIGSGLLAILEFTSAHHCSYTDQIVVRKPEGQLIKLWLYCTALAVMSMPGGLSCRFLLVLLGDCGSKADNPSRPLSIAFFLQLCGYGFVGQVYRSSTLLRVPLREHSDKTTVSTTGICMIAFFMFLTGLGATAGLSCGMNSVAKSFSERSVSLLVRTECSLRLISRIIREARLRL